MVAISLSKNILPQYKTLLYRVRVRIHVRNRNRICIRIRIRVCLRPDFKSFVAVSVSRTCFNHVNFPPPQVFVAGRLKLTKPTCKHLGRKCQLGLRCALSLSLSLLINLACRHDEPDALARNTQTVASAVALIAARNNKSATVLENSNATQSLGKAPRASISPLRISRSPTRY